MLITQDVPRKPGNYVKKLLTLGKLGPCATKGLGIFLSVVVEYNTTRPMDLDGKRSLVSVLPFYRSIFCSFTIAVTQNFVHNME